MRDVSVSLIRSRLRNQRICIHDNTQEKMRRNKHKKKSLRNGERPRGRPDSGSLNRAKSHTKKVLLSEKPEMQRKAEQKKNLLLW